MAQRPDTPPPDSTFLYVPLPPPELLTRYERLYPGAAQLVFENIAAQAAHRREIEKTASQRATWGLFAGVGIALAFLIGAVILGLNGHDWLGGVLGGGTVISLAGTFVSGAVIQRRERAGRPDRTIPAEGGPRQER